MSIYINPYKLFDLDINCSDIELKNNEIQIINRIKRYNDEEDVHIGSNQLPKKQVLLLLKELDNEITRQYHVTIFKHKKLLIFLEYGHLNYFRSDNKSIVSQDSGFLKFITPYFGYQYGETLLQAIKSQDKETLSLLSTTSLPIAGDFEDVCYKYANRYVENKITELKELQENKELLHMSERELLSYLPNRTIELYNMLPDYFSSARNLIGNEVYQLSLVLTQNLGRSDGANAVLKQGLKLKLDETVRKSLESMLHSFTVRAKMPSFIWIAAIAVVALFLIKYIETNFINMP